MRRTATKCAPDGSIISTYEDDVSWVQVRKQRDQALEGSDWRALKDVTLSAAWRDYRQALRDLPGDHAEANDACDHWPVMPGE